MSAALPHRFAPHCCWRGSQLLDQLLRNAEDGEHAHRQQDVGNDGHRFSIRDKPARSIGDRVLAPACKFSLDNGVCN
jgi:hypothetical protein